VVKYIVTDGTRKALITRNCESILSSKRTATSGGRDKLLTIAGRGSLRALVCYPGHCDMCLPCSLSDKLLTTAGRGSLRT
jgi:hypothetical protein